MLISIFEWAADAAEISSGYPMRSDVEALLSDFRDTAQLRQASLEGRRVTSQEYQDLASKTGLRIFQRFSTIYREQYQDSERLHKAIDRMLAALKRRHPSSRQ